MKILIVEDEVSLREMMQSVLKKERFVVEAVGDYRSASLKISDYQYDCVLLDIMLPDNSGLVLLDEMKAAGRRENVIIISAKDSIDDKIKGLDLGADDYLAKPFHVAELVARIRSVTRRKTRDGEKVIRLGNVAVYPDQFKVTVDENDIELVRKEYDILHYFALRPGYLVEKETLAEAVWGDHVDQVDNFDFIYAQMKNLRKKLQSASANIEIKAVYGFGYKLVEI